MVKVLMVANNLTPESGGISTYIMNIYSFMDKERVHIDFVVHTQQPKSLVEHLESQGSRIWLISPFNLIKYRLFWKSFLKEHDDYDFIHVHSFDPTILYLRLADKHGITTIVHSHTVNMPKFDFFDRICRLNQFGSRFVADYFFGCSKKAIADRFGMKIAASSHAEVVPNGIDTERFSFSHNARVSIRAELGVDDDTVLLGQVGRLEYSKNQYFSLDVLKAISERRRDVNLVFIGSGPDEDGLKSKAISLGIEENVVFLGTRTNVEDYLSAFDAFLFPSNYEGLGIALIEAQCSGLPCFASTAIVDEADMKIGLLERISLENGAEEWATQIMKTVSSMQNGSGCECRACYPAKVRENGYGIQESARMMGDFYCNHMANMKG